MIELMEKADSDGVELPPTAPNPVSQQQIQSLLAQTKKEIETRKKQVQEAVSVEYCVCGILWCVGYEVVIQYLPLEAL